MLEYLNNLTLFLPFSSIIKILYVQHFLIIKMITHIINIDVLKTQK